MMRRLIFLVLCGVGLGVSAQAQEVGIEARVTYLAGQYIYLDAGRDLGVQPGDTLTVEQSDAAVRRLVVVSSMADRSVVRFAGAPMPMTVGTMVTLRVPDKADLEIAKGLHAAEKKPVPVAEAPDPEENNPVPVIAQAHRRQQPQVSGRVLMSLSTLRSATQWRIAGGGTSERTFITPSLNLHTTLANLPGGVRLNARLRTDYRYTSGVSIDPAVSVRTYELKAERTFDGYLVQAGRFSNRYARFDGYWDGLLVHLGDRDMGIGTAVGFLPHRSNEGFSAEMPRYGGFAHLEMGDRSSAAYSANVAYNEIRPSNDLENHRFVSLSHQVRRRGTALRNDLQLDRDPHTGGWVATRLVVRGTMVPAPNLSLHARYQRRRPYSIYRVTRIISYRRDQITGTASLRLTGVLLGATVAFNSTEEVDGGMVADGRTLSGSLSIPRTGLLGLSITTMASHWQDEDGASLFVNAGLSRSLGRARTRFQYQFYRTETQDNLLITHAVTLHASRSLGRRFSLSGQIRLQQSSTLRSASMYSGLWYSF